jgi:hypothetical protein
MSQPSIPKAYRDASKAIERSRQAVEILIDKTDRNDYYTLGLLGPIMVELRTALSNIERLGRQRRTNADRGKS